MLATARRPSLLTWAFGTALGIRPARATLPAPAGSGPNVLEPSGLCWQFEGVNGLQPRRAQASKQCAGSYWLRLKCAGTTPLFGDMAIIDGSQEGSCQFRDVASPLDRFSTILEDNFGVQLNQLEKR